MERNRNAEDAGVEETKSNDAQESAAVMEVKLRPRRNIRLKQRRIGREIEHDQMTPAGSEEWTARHGSCSGLAQAPMPSAAEMRKRCVAKAR